MLLQTNSYVVPKDKRSEHARLLRKFRQSLARLGCDHFEVYEQVGSNWSNGETTGRFVQIMRFRDRKHQLAVQSAERNDPAAQQLIQEFCQLINFPYQQQQGLFAVGFYSSALPVAPLRAAGAAAEAPADESPDVDEPNETAGGEAAATEAEGAAEALEGAVGTDDVDEPAPASNEDQGSSAEELPPSGDVDESSIPTGQAEAAAESVEEQRQP